MSFARSKIQLPRFGAELIERPQLQAQLGAALAQRRLVALIAAAGYGKTAALARQMLLLPAGSAYAWVKADEEDDVSRLILCIAHALEPYDPPWRAAPEALASRVSEGRALRSVAEELANTLGAIPVTRGVIALDDLHLVADPAAFGFLAMLLDVLPEPWGLALTTRSDPPLPLARLRVRGELAEFRQQALALSRDEIRLVCARAGGGDDPGLAQRLFDSTQGWAAGVSLSLQGRDTGHWAARQGDRAARRQLYEFMATEVFDRMPAELRDFLVRSSVLPELTAERCAAVTRNDRAEFLLQDLEQRGLFVSELDGDVLTLRLHDLFRDFLDAQLRRQHPQELPTLLRRAAAGEGDHVRRINLLLRAGARAEAERVLADAAPSLLATTSGVQVPWLIKQFPGLESEASPWLAYVSGLWSWYQYEDRACCASMRLAAFGFERQGETAAAQDARCFEAISRFMIGDADAARALMATVAEGPATREVSVMTAYFGYLSEGYGGSAAVATERLSVVLDLLEDGAPIALWNRCIPRMYMLVGRAGLNPLLRRFARGALALATAENDGDSLYIAARQMEAWLTFWQGDVDETRAVIEALQSEIRWQGRTRALRLSHRRMMVTYHGLRGDAARMREALRGILSDDFSAPSMHPDFRVDLLSQICRFYAAFDDWRTVARMMRRLDSPRRQAFFGSIAVAVDCCRARFALHERRDQEALARLRTLVQSSDRHDRQGHDASVRIFLAVAELRARQPQRAWAVLGPLIDAVQASGDLAGVLLAGKTMIDEAAAADWAGFATASGLAVVRHWSARASAWRGTPSAGNTGARQRDVELTARELEVVALIAEGRSNKLIARELGLSPHTVKRHVARILDRLDLRSRSEAAAWYRKRQQQTAFA